VEIPGLLYRNSPASDTNFKGCRSANFNKTTSNEQRKNNKRKDPPTMSGVVPFSVQNRHVVMTLYRRSLRLARDWINRRDHYRTKAQEIRAQFDLYKNVGNPKEVNVCSIVPHYFSTY
jgi:hypothetical protein